jgi:L-ribulose-5-phosphate 3-epimerase
MNAPTLDKRLAVCSWSLQPDNAIDLLDKVQLTGIPRIQCALDPLCHQPEKWETLPILAGERKVEIVSGMFGTVGEDYSTLETIRKTGGVVPDSTWNANWKHIQSVVTLASKMKLRLVTFHAGFLPHDASDPAWSKLRDRIRQIAGLFDAQKISLAMETGQETAETLRDFLLKLGCGNMGVNFDPANLILYDKGDPIQALRVLGPWIQQCHIKDANRTKVPGTWGEEVPVGTGQVNWKEFLRTLSDLKFQGNLVIEREAGTQRVEDIRTARGTLEKIQTA